MTSTSPQAMGSKGKFKETASHLCPISCRMFISRKTPCSMCIACITRAVHSEAMQIKMRVPAIKWWTHATPKVFNSIHLLQSWAEAEAMDMPKIVPGAPQGETLLRGFKLWPSLPEWEGQCGGRRFGGVVIQGPAVSTDAPLSGSKATMLGRVVNSTWSQSLAVGGWELSQHQVPVLATSLAPFDGVLVQDISATVIMGHISHVCDILTWLTAQAVL